jgi:drug/metabolite transporter (DMT)-like permease
MAFFEKNSKLYPVVLIILSCFFFSILAALIKYLNYFIHPFEQAFFRNLFSIFILIPLFLILKKKYIKSKKKKILFLRSLFGAITMLLLFWSYTLIPLSQAMAISFSTPLFIFLGGIVIFKEHTNLRTILVLLLGFFFTLVIIRPDLEIKLGTIVALCAAVSHAITGLLVKNLTKTESVYSIMFYMVLFMSPLTFLPSYSVWELPDSYNVWLLLFLLALVGTTGNFLWTKAISIAPMTEIMPYDFSKLIFSTIFGIIFFEESFDYITLTGGVGIIICNIYLTQNNS